MSNKIQTIVFDDNIIDIFYNPLLTKNPYLLRISGYDSALTEVRAGPEQIKELCSVLNYCGEEEDIGCN